MKKASADKLATKAIKKINTQLARATDLATAGKTPGERAAGAWALQKIENRIRLMAPVNQEERTSALEVNRLDSLGNYKSYPAVDSRINLIPNAYKNFPYKDEFGMDESFLIQKANPLKDEIILKGLYSGKQIALNLSEYHEFFGI